MNTIKSHTSKSGAYIHSGPREYQVYADLGRDALTAVVEVDTDCPGYVYTYFMRGGITEGKMTVDELRKGAQALEELLQVADQAWPRKMRRERMLD